MLPNIKCEAEVLQRIMRDEHSIEIPDWKALEIMYLVKEIDINEDRQKILQSYKGGRYRFKK